VIALTSTEIIFRTGPPQQAPGTSTSGAALALKDSAAHWLAATYAVGATEAILAVDLEGDATLSTVDLPSVLQQWTRRSVRPLTSVEARVIGSAQDEEFDLGLIRDEDLLP
jgi:hypothetical protein